MKSKIMQKISCLFLAGALMVSALAGACTVTAFAEETPDPASEAEEAAEEAEAPATEEAEEAEEAAAEAAEEEEPQEFTVETDEGRTETFVNETGDPIADVSYEEDGDEKTLLVTEEDGTVHTFEGADLSQAGGYSIEKKLSFFFVCGTQSDGQEKWFYETADDITLDTPVTMYTVGMVNIREDPDGDSGLVATADLGSELEVLGGTSKWFLVNQEDASGYVAARYLTEDRDEADAAVAAEASAAAAAQAAAEAAAAQAAAEAAAAASSAGSYDYSYDSGSSYDYSYSSGGSAGSAPTEVGREAVYDCDGSGGGYYIITYSDGSESYEDF